MNDVRAQPAASSPSPQVASLIVGFPEDPDDRRPVKAVYGPTLSPGLPLSQAAQGMKRTRPAGRPCGHNTGGAVCRGPPGG